VVASGGDGVADVLVDAFRLGGDVEDESLFALRSGGGRVEEGVVTERPCHEAEGDLLSVHPVGSRIGRVVSRPVFDESPEGFWVFFVLGGGVGADEGIDGGKAVGFPDILNIVMSLRVFEKQSPNTLEIASARTSRAPRNDMIIGDL
jgi:hypothetical protein